MTLRVLKLGGSLLDLPALATRLDCWQARQQPWTNVMVVGGGPWADAIRTADRIHGLGDAAAHRLCLEAMGVTGALAHALFAGSRLCAGLEDVDPRLARRLQILDVRSLVDGWTALEGAEPLPASWRVTSDSIASCVAQTLGAAELVLLKSALPPERLGVEALAEKGFVDEYFPQAWLPHVVAGTALRIVNLRGEECPEQYVVAGRSPRVLDRTA
jgi:aspartokinase-like uncharacterized kinase